MDGLAEEGQLTPEHLVICRVGKVLVRKLLLRGYPVTVLVRPGSPGIPDLPDAVTVVEGDVGEYADLRRAMQGVSKVHPYQ